jgi:pimeloyl-ACP methyl ester carboxylesterase
MFAQINAETGLYYEQTGDGVPILLIHPAGANASTWGAVVDELSTAGRVITYDRRGYARSGGVPLTSIAAHAEDAAGLLDELRASGAVVAGISIGATIALDLARLRPDLVRAVVAYESPWHITHRPPSRAEAAALMKMTWLSRRHRDPEAAAAFLRFAYSYRDGGSAWDRFPEPWRAVAAENAHASLVDIRVAVGGYPSRKQLASITTPVVCSCGSRCHPKMLRVTQGLSRVIPGATFERVDGAGHAAAFDSPTGFAKVILDVLTPASPRPARSAMPNR